VSGAAYRPGPVGRHCPAAAPRCVRRRGWRGRPSRGVTGTVVVLRDPAGTASGQPSACAEQPAGGPTGSVTRCGPDPCWCTRQTSAVRTTRAPRAPAGPGVPPGRPVHSGRCRTTCTPDVPDRAVVGARGSADAGRGQAAGRSPVAGGRGGAAHPRGRPVPVDHRSEPCPRTSGCGGQGSVTRWAGRVDAWNRRQRCDGGPRAGDRGAGRSRGGGRGRSVVRTRPARPRAAGGASG
jgi:hypothetical protein